MTTASSITHPPARVSPLAPAYYLGRPARVWFEAMRPRRNATVVAPRKPRAAAAA
jgi:hypothetical protein